MRKSLEGLDLQWQKALSWQSSWDGIQSRASTVIEAMKADIEYYEEECLMALKAHVQHVTQAVVLMHLMRLVLVGVYSNDEAYSVITNDGGSRLELTAGEGDGCEESKGVHEWVFGPQWSVRIPRGKSCFSLIALHSYSSTASRLWRNSLGLVSGKMKDYSHQTVEQHAGAIPP